MNKSLVFYPEMQVSQVAPFSLKESQWNKTSVVEDKVQNSKRESSGKKRERKPRIRINGDLSTKKRARRSKSKG